MTGRHECIFQRNKGHGGGREKKLLPSGGSRVDNNKIYTTDSTDRISLLRVCVLKIVHFFLLIIFLFQYLSAHKYS